jgi:4-amino-4-deoxy-L-arabinose transferase-like glycosyltransferase
MPDIGLLQGAPRPRLAKPPAGIAATIAAPSAPPGAEPAGAVGVAPHAAVVSEFVPMAVLRAPASFAAPGPIVVSVADEPIVMSMADEPAAPAPAASAPVVIPPPPASPPRDAVEPVQAVAAAAPASAAVTSVEVGRSERGGTSPPAMPAHAAAPIRPGDLLWLLLGLLIIVGTGLGIRDPWPADEPRFASLARDMAQSGEWLFPRVGGDLYQDKPPLYFWLLTLSYTLFGSVKASFLLPSFLAAGGILFLVYDFGRRTVSREAGLSAAILVLCSLQFVLATRGAQIDPTLCLLTTFSIYALLRHLLLGHGWRWYLLAGFAAGLGVFTKGVGFLPVLMLIPFFLLRGFGWNGLAKLDAGTLGWRWWLAPLAMLFAISLWFVPMLLAASSGSPEYAAYRDEILFKQTVGRYAAAWHHVKAWYYFLVEVIPALWLPWSVLLFWLAPGFKAAFARRDARVWLPLGWVLLVLLFFTMSPGKRGIYILPALPALALASMPLLGEVLARRGVRVAGYVLGIGFLLAGLALLIGHAAGAAFARRALEDANLASATALYVFVALCGAGLLIARWRQPLLAWPAALGALTITFSYFIAPAMNGERSGRDFVSAALAQVQPGEELGLVAYKEQFLLYLDRPTTNFGHRRWQEGPQEAFDAAAWLNAAPGRVLLVPDDQLKPRGSSVECFPANRTAVGTSSRDHWFLVRAPAAAECAALGNSARAIGYPARAL